MLIINVPLILRFFLSLPQVLLNMGSNKKPHCARECILKSNQCKSKACQGRQRTLKSLFKFQARQILKGLYLPNSNKPQKRTSLENDRTRGRSKCRKLNRKERKLSPEVCATTRKRYKDSTSVGEKTSSSCRMKRNVERKSKKLHKKTGRNCKTSDPSVKETEATVKNHTIHDVEDHIEHEGVSALQSKMSPTSLRPTVKRDHRRKCRGGGTEECVGKKRSSGGRPKKISKKTGATTEKEKLDNIVNNVESQTGTVRTEWTLKNQWKKVGLQYYDLKGMISEKRVKALYNSYYKQKKEMKGSLHEFSKRRMTYQCEETSKNRRKAEKHSVEGHRKPADGLEMPAYIPHLPHDQISDSPPHEGIPDLLCRGGQNSANDYVMESLPMSITHEFVMRDDESNNSTSHHMARQEKL